MSLPRRILVWLATYWIRVAVFVLVLAIGSSIVGSIPRTHLTLEAGTAGGLFDAMALGLADDLEEYGITVEVVNRNDSLNIVSDIADPTSAVDGGFISSTVPARLESSVRQVGTVMFSPVYIVTNVESGITSLADISGRTIGTYPKGSSAWGTCDYLFRSYGLDLATESVTFANALTLVDQVTSGQLDVACLIDVPPGSRIPYATASLQKFTDPRLRVLEIPEADAIAMKRDYLVPIEIESGSFEVFPDPRPAQNIETNASVITFAAKSDLPPELVIIIAQSLRDEYSHGTSVNPPGSFPSLNYSSLVPFDQARTVYTNGLPWLFQNFAFELAAFIDKFLSTYGLFLTTLIIVLSITDNIGFVKPLQLVRKSRPARVKLILEALTQRAEDHNALSRRDARSIASAERWLRSESENLSDIEALIERAKSFDERAT